MKKVTIYTDGSCPANPGPGGWAAILLYNGHEKRICGRYNLTTNSRMEIIAVVEGIKAVTEPCELEVISDSEYVVNTINIWIHNWIKNDFKNKKNVDLWKLYLEVSKPHKVKATWTKAHNENYYNEACDELAGSNAEIALDDSEYIK